MRPWRLRLTAVLLLVIAAAPLGGAVTYYAVLIRSLDPLDQVVLENVRLNGKDLLHRLPAPEAAARPIPKSQYDKLPKLPFAEVVSFRVASGRLDVRTRSRGEAAALPANFKAWPRGTAEPMAMVRAATLSGRVLPNRQSVSYPLKEGWVVYLFSARPAEDAVSFAVAETRNTQAVWEEFLRKFPASPHVATARQALAPFYLAHARAALQRFQSALQEKKSGFAALGEAREWLDRIRPLNVQSPAIVELDAAVSKVENELADTLRQARLLAENADFPAALRTLEPLRHFREEYPALATELETIPRLASRHHLNQARQLLARNQFDDAVKQTETAASYLPSDEIPLLRREIEVQRVAFLRQQDIRETTTRVREAAGRKDYATAFDTLAALSLRYPDEAGVRQELASLQATYRNTLLAEVAPVEKLHTPIRGPADEEVLLRMQSRLARLSEFDSTPELAVRRDRLSTHLADYYRQRAAKLAPATAAELSPLAFAYLQQAYHFALNKSDFATFVPWRERLENQLRIRVALTFRDQTPESSGQYAIAELSARLSQAIQRSGLPNVQVLETRSEGSAPVLEFVVELLSTSVREESQVEAIKSEYSAGMMQVPNPQWRDAKADYDRAVEAFEQTRNRIEQERRRKKPSDKERRAQEDTLAKADAALKEAKQKLDAVSAYVEREDIRPYEFTHRTITRTGQIRLTSRWVNVVTGIREVPQIVEEKEPATAVEISGVNPADKQGHRNQPANLLDAETLRGRVLAKAQEKLTEQVLMYLKMYIGRDYERARQKAARGEAEGAAEDYIRFLFNCALDDPRRGEALQFLQRQFHLVALGDWLVAARQR